MHSYSRLQQLIITVLFVSWLTTSCYLLTGSPAFVTWRVCYSGHLQENLQNDPMTEGLCQSNTHGVALCHSFPPTYEIISILNRIPFCTCCKYIFRTVKHILGACGNCVFVYLGLEKRNVKKMQRVIHAR